MPWTIDDVDKHKKGLTVKQKQAWVAVANSSLGRCREEGGHDCDKHAIIRANGAVEAIRMLDKDKITEQDHVETHEAEITGDVVTLCEGAVARDGTVTVKIIRPGWGSSGYYPTETLSRDGPKVFTKGTKMYWDHQTADEERSKPEGSLDRLAGEFVTDAAWRDEGADGPGLYADAKVFKRFADPVNELAPHIGVSIRAMGRAQEGEAEGKKGPIIAALTAAKSVDFVTTPGAGGKVLQLFESTRKLQEAAIVNEQEAQVLRETNDALVADNKRLTEALLAREARAFVAEALAESKLPDPAVKRLQAQLEAAPSIVDGKLAQEAYRAVIDKAVEAERAYIVSISPASGDIRGMGETPPAKPKGSLKESYRDFWISAGKTPEEADKLATIAAQGR